MTPPCVQALPSVGVVVAVVAAVVEAVVGAIVAVVYAMQSMFADPDT